MNKINLISSMEAHLLVDKAIISTLNSLKESPLKSIREAAEFWEKKLGEPPVRKNNHREVNRDFDGDSLI